MIKVYQVIDPRFVDSRVPALDELEYVANVDTNDLDDAYELTNSIHCPWWTNKGVTFLGSFDHGMEGCRSTSVGDILQTENGYFIVASCGFRKVELS